MNGEERRFLISEQGLPGLNSVGAKKGSYQQALPGRKCKDLGVLIIQRRTLA